MPFNSRNQGSKCVSMTWRAICARPYLRQQLVQFLFTILQLGPVITLATSEFVIVNNE